MFVRGGLNFEPSYFANQIRKGWGKGIFSRGGEPTPLDLISERNLFRVPLKFARSC